MTRKNFWMIIPSVLLPYLVLFTAFLMLHSKRVPLFTWIIDDLSGGNAWLPVLFLIIYALIVSVLIGIFVVLSIRNSGDPLFLAKTAMIVKLLQIPAYLVIFVLGLLYSIMVFTVGLTIGFIIFDFLSLWLSGLLVIASVINCKCSKKISNEQTVLFILSQFVFCLDVLAAIIWYRKLKKFN